MIFRRNPVMIVQSERGSKQLSFPKDFANMMRSIYTEAKKPESRLSKLAAQKKTK